MAFQIKRIYEPASPSDGTRVLVDRLWPRGVRKADAHIDLWMKDVAPSPGLRQWFQHDPERFDTFSRRYATELKTNPAVAELRKLGKGKQLVTLLYGAHDPQINHARVLQAALTGRRAAAAAKTRPSTKRTRTPTPPKRRVTARH